MKTRLILNLSLAFFAGCFIAPCSAETICGLEKKACENECPKKDGDEKKACMTKCEELETQCENKVT